jgi:hypothetical protein
VAAAGGADWIGVRVGLRGADLLLSRGGATEVLCRQGAKAALLARARGLTLALRRTCPAGV